MTLTDFEPRRKGRPSIEEIPLPPHVQRALVILRSPQPFIFAYKLNAS